MEPIGKNLCTRRLVRNGVTFFAVISRVVGFAIAQRLHTSALMAELRFDFYSFDKDWAGLSCFTMH